MLASLPGSRAVAAVLVAALGLIYLAAPGRGQERFVDQVINRQTVERMHEGAGYYRAMSVSLKKNTDEPSSARAFRQPLAFVLWRVLPSAKARWAAFVLLAVAAGLATAATTPFSLSAPLITLTLLRAGRPHDSGGWVDQQLLVEVWTGALVVLSVAAWRKGWMKISALLAAVGTLFRELAVLLLIGGLWSAARSRRVRIVWLVALSGTAAAVVWHYVVASHYLSPTGSQAPLAGTGGWGRVLDMAGVGFPHRAVAGALFWSLAWWRLKSDPKLARLVGPILLLPLLGLVVGRDYWGFVVLPLVVLLALEGVWMRLTRSATPT